MKRFLHGHATHPDPSMALALAAAQVEAQRHAAGAAAAPTLGWVYLTDACAAHAEGLLDEMRTRWPGVQWVGATGVGIAANGAEYFDEPAVSILLGEIPREQFRVFSGARPLGDFPARAANVHADPATHELAELIHDMSRRTSSGYLFGGLASSARAQPLHIADRPLSGGLSGVAFGPRVRILSRVTQGCTPVGPQREVTAAERNVITALDGEPALDCLLRDMRLEGTEPRAALPTLRQVLVGLADPAGGDRPPEAATPGAARAGSFDSAVGARSRRGAFGDEVRVRHLIGLDPGRRGIAIADVAAEGMQLAFCVRNVDAARRDLTRICAELREEVEPENLPLPNALALLRGGADAGGTGAAHGIAGAIYVSCSGRGGGHFGAPSAELAIVRHALGDVPLAGFFAAGEIARENLYGYTGVLTVFPSAP